MEVSANELVYTDGRTHEKWQWPLKYLRKYGCDGNVFSFEAGRKCPGGEGLYAFSTHRASILFDMVAMNINQGSLQQPGEQSPFPSEVRPPDASALSFTRQVSGSLPTSPQPPLVPQPIPPQSLQQPNYENMDVSGKHLLDVSADVSSGESLVPKPESPPPVVPECKKVHYREVVFETTPEEHPLPQVDPAQRTSYTKIDFHQTEKYNERRNGALPFRHTRASTSSVGGSGSGSGMGHRQRINTCPPVPGTSRHSVSSSQSSLNSMTESSRDVRSPTKPNGSIPGPQTSTPDPQHTTYQNLVLGSSGPSIPQPSYLNVNVGCGDVNQLIVSPSTSTPQPQQQQQQPNYANFNITPGATNSHNYRNVTCGELPTIHGDQMAHYADLDLSGRKTSTATPQQYMQLDFSTATNQSQLSEKRNSPEATPVEAKAAVAPSLTPLPKVSDDKVNYGVLNFEAMNAISELHKQREQENLEKEKEIREREREREKEKTGTRKKHK